MTSGFPKLYHEKSGLYETFLFKLVVLSQRCFSLSTACVAQKGKHFLDKISQIPM